MSDYARLVVDLPKPKIAAGTQVKNVRVIGGGYVFDAEVLGRWQRFSTDDDLPAFTDKGRAQRARSPHRHVTLEQGRPAVNSEPTAGPALAVRLTEKQRIAVKKKALKLSLSPSAYLRMLLIKDGMPK